MMSEPPAVCMDCGAAMTGSSAGAMCVSCLLQTGAALVIRSGGDGGKEPFPIPFGEYDLLHELGRGGAGRVFAARHRKLGRAVALKVLAGGELAPRDFVQRFRIEALAAASLRHPSIVPVFEIGEHDGQPFLVMPIIAGGSLAGHLAKDRVSLALPRKAAGLIATLARAIHHAHQRGVLHRDIKPGNILLDEDGGPHLTDFGLARLTEKDSTLTRTHVMLGTPAYMAPEQARGGGGITTAADVYGLGAVLYELLTGQPPFAGGTTFATVKMLLETEVRRPASLVPRLDRGMETICLKCLEKNPLQRYASAHALAEDLDRWLRHEPILARPVSTVERIGKWMRRHRAMTTGLTALFLSICTGVTLLAAAKGKLEKAGIRLALMVEEQRQDLVRLNVETGHRLAAEGDGFAALGFFAEAAHLDEAVPDRLALHQFRLAAVLGQLPVLEQELRHGAAVNAAEFSPDGTRIVTACSDHTAQVWNAATGQPVTPRLPHAGPVWWAGFAAGGKRVITRTFSGEIQLWDSVSGSPAGGPFTGRAAMLEIDGVPAAVGLSPDGILMAVLKKNAVEIRRTDNGQSIHPALACDGLPNAALFTPDGTRLAVLCELGEMTLFETATGRELAVSQDSQGWRTGAWTEDGSRLAITDRHFGVRMKNDTLTTLQPVFPHMAMVLGCAWSGDADRLLTWSHDNSLMLWNPENAQPLVLPMRHHGPVLAAAFSPDESTIASASADGTVRLWDPKSGRAHGPVLHHRGPARDVSWDASGGRLLTASADGSARLWHMDPIKKNRLEWNIGQPVQHAGLSPDGSTAALQSLDHEVWLVSTLNAGARPVKLVDPTAKMHPVHFAWQGADRVVTLDIDGRLREWEASTAVLRRTWQCGAPAEPGKRIIDVIDQIEFSPDGRFFAGIPPHGPPLMLETASGQKVRSLGLTACGRLAWSPCSRFLIACQTGRADLYAVETGVLTASIPIPAGTLFLIPDFHARRLACILGDSSILLIDARTGAVLAGPLRHESMIRHAAFTADGSILASVGHDAALRLWSTATGAPLAVPMPHPAYVLEVAAHPSGRAFLTAGNDGVARLWQVPDLIQGASAMRDLAERLSGRPGLRKAP